MVGGGAGTKRAPPASHPQRGARSGRGSQLRMEAGGWGGAAYQRLTVGSDPGLGKSGSAPLADVPQASGPDSGQSVTDLPPSLGPLQKLRFKNGGSARGGCLPTEPETARVVGRTNPAAALELFLDPFFCPLRPFG